jgi:serralysin
MSLYVSGTTGNDIIEGSQEPDILRGLGGSDLLKGRGGNDVLYGNSGADRIYGAGGADTIIGGHDADKLWGGAGRDGFIYNTVADSTHAAPDIIFDFTEEDQLDFSQVDTGNASEFFVRIADGADFTDAGQLRLTYDGTYTHVDLNTDADAAPEMTVLLLGQIVYPADQDWNM